MVKTRLEQIKKKVKLSKILGLTQMIWETTIDDNTLSKLKSLNYSVEQEHFNRFYVISW